MKFRSIFLTVMMLFTLVFSAGVQAQDDMLEGVDLCFGLDEADCTVINEASANGIGDAESYTVDVAIDFAGDELSALFELLGGFGLDLGGIADMNAATFTVDGTFDMIAPVDEDDSGAFTGSYTASWSQDGGDVTEVAMDVIVVDNFMYMNQGDGWQSVDLDAVAENEALEGQMALFGLGGDDMAEGDDAPAAAAGGFDPALFINVFAMIDVPGFIVYERSGDDFAFAIDFEQSQTLLEEENAEQLDALIAQVAEADPMSAIFLDPVIRLFDGGTLNVVQTVDTERNIVTAYDVDVDLDLAPGVLATGIDAISTIDLTADIAFSNFDGVGAIEAPADAVDVTAEFAEWAAGLFPAPEAEMEEETDG